MNDEERWLPASGYAGFYEVSDQGRIFSLPRKASKGGIRKLSKNGKGYDIVILSKYGETKSILVHRLVLETFIGPCPPKMQACHGKNGKSDNSLANLYWGTPSRNQLDRRRDGTSNQGERCAAAKLTESIVAECRRRYLAGEQQSILCAEFGVTSGAMSNAIHGKTWAHLTDPPPIPRNYDGRSHRSWSLEKREQMREAGHKGAEARWHEKSPPPVRKGR